LFCAKTFKEIARKARSRDFFIFGLIYEFGLNVSKAKNRGFAAILHQ